MQILSGIELRNKTRENLKQSITKIREGDADNFIPPTLVIIQVGDNKSSNVYIEQKKKFAEYIGALALHVKLNEDTTEDDLIAEIKNYNADNSVHGIIVQLPLPREISVNRVTDSIDFRKDVDGLSSTNLGLLVKRNFNLDKGTGFPGLIPATAKGVLSLLEENNIKIEGKNVCVLGRSVLVGKPLAILMLAKNATVTVCHSKTENVERFSREADILISAIGSPKKINSDFVSNNQIIIDVGITAIEERDENGDTVKKLYGDVDFDDVKNNVSAISPVPGGVGPMTVCSLFENLFETYRNTLI